MFRILIVDQEANLEDSLNILLKTNEREICFAKNIDDACISLKCCEYDVIIMDIMMQRLAEREDLLVVLKNLRSETQIVFTGITKLGMPIKDLQDKIFKTIARPMIMHNFMNKLNKILFFKALLNSRSYLIQYYEKLFSMQVKSENVKDLAFYMALMENHDSYSANHQRRVGNLASEIAKFMGFEASRIDLIRFTGYLHDIGKLRVPRVYLNKRSPLTCLERQVINTHAEKGYEMIKSCNCCLHAANIVFQHHERLDGSGYPQGIGKKDILDESLIIMVADVTDAMLSDRPYRPAIRLDDVLTELKKNAGILYSPDVVDVCCFLFNNKRYASQNIYV